MMPILGFIKCFAKFQKFNLRTWKGACVCLFFVMPYTFIGVGRFKMVQSTMSLSYIAPYICTLLKRPETGLCFGHLTKKDIHMLLKQFGDCNAQHFMNLFSKSGQNRSQKTFYELVIFEWNFFTILPFGNKPACT
jgi:hypothetical protein